MTGPKRPLVPALALLLALGAGHADAANVLAPFSADYQASYMGMQAEGKMTLAAQGDDRWK